jgi:RHS repeat-associated protein
VIDALEHETRYEYNERDRVTKQVDPVGAVTIWQYNDKGNLIAFTRPHRAGEDPAAYTTTMTYDARGHRTSVRRPDGSSWTSEYDENGKLLAVRDGAGNLLEQRQYNARGEVISESDRFGTTEYQDLTESGQPRRTVDPDGSVTTAQYGPIGQVTTMTSPVGTWSFQYNRLGEPTQADYGAGMVVQTEYDEYGSLIAQTSPLTGRTTRRFTESGRLEAWGRAGGPEISYQRDAAGRVIGVTDPGGRSVTYGYDAAGRINRMTDPATGERLLQLDAAGRVTKMTNALGHETSLGYYPDGSVESRRDHLGREWQFRYGPGFSVVVDPLSRTARTEVGPEGEVTRVVYPDDSEDRFEYLAGTPQGEREAFLTRIAPAGGGERLFTYDALGRLASATDLAGAAWTYQTTILGDKTTISAPGGALVREDSFNAAGELTARRFGDGGIYELDYGLGTDPARIVKPSGVEVALEYNPSGQLVSRTSTSGESESFTWTGDGSLAGFVDATGSTTYGLDAAGRLASLTQADGSRVVYGHDVLGRVTSVTVQAPGASTGSTTTYRYDEVGNLTEVDDPVAGVTSFAYDRANRLTGRTLPNGVASAWGYDLRDRILSVEHRGADGSVLASFVYTRGSRGEISRVTREDGSRIEYGYDAALRLTSESRRDSAGTVLAEILYTYDAAGNRLTVTKEGVTRESSYLSAFRLSQVKVGAAVEQSYSWDADGRVAAMSREGTTWTLGYDTKDALRSVSDGSRTLRYNHDAQGRRVAASDGTTSRQFLVAPVLGSGLDSVHLATGGGATSTFVWAGPQPLARIDGAAVRYFLTDGIGSVIGLVDSAGQVTARREFDAFGNLHSASGEPTPAHLGGDLAFQGEWREELTGLYHMRARDYDPVTGRFLSRDPAEVEPLEPESFHPYTFAYGNPLLYSDPTGMFTMVEINVTMTIDNIISAIKTAALNKIRQEVIEEVQEAAVNFLLQMIGSWVGFDLSMFAETAGSPLWQIGREFEELAHESLCTILPRGVYFEAGIDQTSGEAKDNGWTCPTSNRHGFAGVAGIRRPDFLINQGSPEKGSKSLLIGEIKLSIGSFYRAWKGKQKGQWRAIHNHSKKHAWFPHAVVLFAFKGGTEVQRKWLEKLLVENGHLPVIIVILGD